MRDLERTKAGLKEMIGKRVLLKNRESRFGTWSGENETELVTLQNALRLLTRPAGDWQKYVNKYDLVDWIAEEFRAGENAAVDFCCSAIEDHINDMDYMSADGVLFRVSFDDFVEPPDPFDRADFEHDDLLEDEWNG